MDQNGESGRKRIDLRKEAEDKDFVMIRMDMVIRGKEK